MDDVDDVIEGYLPVRALGGPTNRPEPGVADGTDTPTAPANSARDKRRR